MSYAMIWVETLVAVLLFVATTAACVARWRRRWQRLTVLLVVTLPLVGAAASATYGIGYVKYAIHLESIGFIATLSWTVLFITGVAVLFWCGLGRAGNEPPLALDWPSGRLAVGFAAMAVLLYITLANLDLAMRTQQASLRAEASAKLLALSPARVPDVDNAALVYQRAFDNLTPLDKLPPAWKDKADDWFDRAHKPFDAKDKDLLDFLAAQQRGLALLYQAAASPSCAFDHDYTENIVMQLPELEQLHRAAEVLALHAVVKADDGDFRTALSDIDTLFGIARHANEPILISVINALRIEELAVRTLEEVLSLAKPGDLKPEHFAGNEHLLNEPASHRRDVVHALQVEEAMFGLAIYGSLGEEPNLMHAVIGNDATFGAAVWLWRIFHMTDDLAAYRGLMARMRLLAERPYFQAHTDWQSLEQHMKTQKEGFFAWLLVPNVWKCAVRAAEADAHRRLARLAVAATLYKLKNGKYPNKMEELTPEFLPQPLLDPFTGKTLRMRADGDGLILSSIHPDLPPALTIKQRDIVFRLK
jgi:hypothetical protein